MAKIDDLLSGDGDDEIDPEYVAAQRASRRAKRDRPKGSEARASSPRVQSKPESATATAKGPIATTNLSPVICKAQTTVRHPRDHADPALRGQPILNADGARQYRPCEARAMKGQEVCVSHGGNAPQAQKAAKLRLLAATEPLIAALVRIGLNETLTPADRTRAINSALDRAGFRGGVDLNVETPGWQQLLGELFGRGEQSSTQDDVIEAEVVEGEPVDIAELRAAMGQQPEKYEPDPRDRPNYVNGDEAMPEAWQRSARNARVRR